MNIGILGFGAQGKVAYEHWNTPDNRLVICDRDENLELPEGAESRLGPNNLDGIEEFDLLVRSPVLKPSAIVEAAGSPAILDKVTTVTNEFMRVCPTKNIIGVTGTKGKGTTSTFITKMLEAAGMRVHLGGNIGIPPLDLLKNDIKPEDWVILELANFQLVDLKHSPHIGVCVVVTPEHLDWHENTEAYIEAKQQMFAHQSPNDIAIYYNESEYSKQVASVSPGQKIPYFNPPGAFVRDNQIVIEDVVICNVDEVKILGKHNWQNICAAVTAVWQVSQDVAAIRSVVTSLQALEHRLEPVRELDGVQYYSDSFSSGPLATVAAIEAIEQPKVMIVGGFDRGINLDKLAEGAVEHDTDIRKMLVIGAAAKRIGQSFDEHGYTNYQILAANTMPEIVAAARDTAQPGDAVVLSPGFASFDMFKNFADRGDQFKNVVNSL